jgi:hypothetical protein
MKESKLLERTVGNLVSALQEETKRFVHNKRASRGFTSDLLLALITLSNLPFNLTKQRPRV